MAERDIFVGLVAISLGAFLVVSAVRDSKWYFELRTAQWLCRKIGRRAARAIVGIVGACTCVLGVLLMLGAFSRPVSLQQRRGVDVSHSKLAAALQVCERLRFVV